MIASRITTKGQVTIPKKIREFLKVSAFDKIEFTPLEDGKVLITRETCSAQALFGMLKHKKLAKPISVEEMQAAIDKRRSKRSSS